MGAIKQNAPASASPSAAFFGQAAPENTLLARGLTRSPAPRPLSPSEFAGLLREVHGIGVSERWVQRQCALGRIAFVRLPYYGRRLIPATEAARFASALAAVSIREGCA